MLEIKNVTKIYKTKGGVPTRALDDVSISFGETGLVFLLGKSGSGKSTLLNVSGGLDEPTSGEIIVKGKSSKDFSGSDFDSYRNTFVGFIFQEYNVLDEFNVEDNIALALELQGKPKDREKIKALLEEVDLQNFAKRKPNTLSGGQKQRIAIARALIKDPQIIMADEPTGALDSATGKQVFDTLKKLSKTRLVLVVSHDREFAEIYGDRIVELKDGKIISDVTKRSVAPESMDENVSIIGGDTLTIKSGAKLTESNINAIQSFISAAEGDVIITRGEHEITAFKKATRMSDDGGTESFSSTAANDVQLKEYKKEDSKFIRSRLPALKAIKIGASGLKLKPVRLVFTIFLSFVAFVMFGLLSTMMLYNEQQVAESSFISSGENYFNVGKNYHYVYHLSDGYEYDSQYNYRQAKFTPAELQTFRQNYGGGVFGGYETYSFTPTNIEVSNNYKNYYLPRISTVTEVEDGSHTLPLVMGDYPRNTYEICVSTYFIEVLKNADLYLKNENGESVDADGRPVKSEVSVKINSTAEAIGKYITVRNYYGNTDYLAFKITGVFDSGEVDSQYDSVREGEMGMSYYMYQQYLESSLHCMAIVSDTFYSDVLSKMGSSSYEEFNWIYNSVALQTYDRYSGELYKFYWCSAAKVYNSDEAYYNTYSIADGKQVQSLFGNQIIISFGALDSILDNLYYEYYSNTHPQPFEEDFITGTDEFGNKVIDYDAYNRALSEWNSEWNSDRQTYERVRQIMYYGYIYEYNYETEMGEYYYPTDSETEKCIQWYNNNVLSCIDGTLNILLAEGERDGVEYQVAGYYVPNEKSNEGLYVTHELYDKLTEGDYVYSYEETKYVPPKDGRYDNIFIPYDHTVESYRNLASIIGYENIDDFDVFYTLNSPLYESVQLINDYVEMLSTIFLWVGVVFAVFASLLMFNFISMSISNKRKEIGILRAVGARGLDVFKIFFAEAGIISGICFVLSVVGSFMLCSFLNNILRAEAGLMVTIFVFGIASVAIMAAIAAIIAFISTFLPVYFAARKKPVESIRAL